MEVYKALDLLAIKLMASALIPPSEKGQRNFSDALVFRMSLALLVLHLKTFRTTNRLEIPCLLGVLFSGQT